MERRHYFSSEESNRIRLSAQRLGCPADSVQDVIDFAMEKFINDIKGLSTAERFALFDQIMTKHKADNGNPAGALPMSD